MFDIAATLTSIQQWILQLWWLWLFIALFFLSKSLWKSYIQEHYKRSIPWVMLELHIPRELRRSPRAMEQVFMSIHGVRNSPSNVKEEWWEGEVPMWFSCEIASFSGEIHFYMRVPAKHRNMIEAAVYAQYPDIEITEVADDYTNRLPPTILELFKSGYDLFGNELKLAKHDAYPIRTYIDFEDNEEDRQLDPISALLETLAKLKPGEHIWIQILIQPTGDEWRKLGEEKVSELKEKTGRTQVETSSGKFTWIERSPGETESMKAIERNIAKPGFHAIIRYLYLAPKSILDDGFGRRAVFSAFNQYASASLNKFAHNVKAWTRASFWYWPHFFPQRRKYARKVRIYEAYKTRKIHDETAVSKVLDMKFFHWGLGAQSQGRMILNVEELATIYHPPTMAVLTGPLIKRVEAKKTGPPAGLAIYGEGEEGLPDIKTKKK